MLGAVKYGATAFQKGIESSGEIILLPAIECGKAERLDLGFGKANAFGRDCRRNRRSRDHPNANTEPEEIATTAWRHALIARLQ